MKHSHSNNELNSETSPYLLQHAENPIHWKAYSPRIFEQAKAENKLIVISIGYAACHWCHVMEKESFEMNDVAEVMNAHYISVKVDREERPDVDHIYIEAVQLMTGSAGWPLNVITLPDGRPVWGGTYFRKEEWIDALTQIQKLFQQSPEELYNYAARLEQGLNLAFEIGINKNRYNFRTFDWERIIKMFILSFDRVNGGFGQAPKFMLPANLKFLLKYSFVKNDKNIADFVLSTLKKMGQRGIFDQINGGFSRYSTDSTWRIPHFEKMLYDNGQLLSVYADAYKLSKNPFFKKIIEKTIQFISKNLTDPSGAFYSSLDADSLNTKNEWEEGAFYTFSSEELKEKITDYKLFSEYYFIKPESTWEGKHILHRRFSDSDFANKFKISTDLLEEKKDKWLTELKNIQKNRKLPRLDDKSLTSWNAIMLIGLLDSYTALGNYDYLKMAVENANFIKSYQLQDNFELFRNYKEGKSTISGFLEDYAWTISAFIKLYETTSDEQWLEIAHTLLKKTLSDFLDEGAAVFSFTSNKTKQSFIRPNDFHDDVIPSSNAIMAENLFRLSRYYGNIKYEDLSKQLIKNLIERMETYPTGFSHWLNVLLNFSDDSYELAIVGNNSHSVNQKFLSHYIPNALVAASENKSSIPILARRFKKGKDLFYLCQNHSCEKPVTNIDLIIEKLKL